jgi:hypothetical protein
MKEQIIKRLTRNLVLTFIISCIVIAVTFPIFYYKRMGSTEVSSGVALFIIGGFVFSFFLSVLSLPVFFNVNEKIRNNRLCSALTFFLLPLSFAATLFLNTHPDLLPIDFIMTLPFLVLEVYFYIDFRKSCGK